LEFSRPSNFELQARVISLLLSVTTCQTSAPAIVAGTLFGLGSLFRNISGQIEPVVVDEQAFRSLVSGQTTGLVPSFQRLVLRLFSLVYGSIIRMRNRMFDLGFKPIRTAPVLVISVGNITTGGTGKTPVAALVIRILQELGLAPGLVSRGYQSLDESGNDELRVLSILCPGVPHLQDRNRFQAVQELLQSHPVQAVVMDDGFQHRQLHRDLDVVLIDATNPFGYDYLLPRGLLREPLQGLRRADLVMLTRSDLATAEQLSVISQQILTVSPHLRERMLKIAFQPVSIRSANGERRELSILRSDKLLLIGGIGNPDAFEATCRQAGLTIAGTMWFPDHHHYTPEDLRKIELERVRLQAGRVLTTLKDLVKLPIDTDFEALEIAAELPDPQHREILQATLARVSNTRRNDS
jgi:tetraacyldisaccharide 4'-kinase